MASQKRPVSVTILHASNIRKPRPTAGLQPVAAVTVDGSSEKLITPPAFPGDPCEPVWKCRFTLFVEEDLVSGDSPSDIKIELFDSPNLDFTLGTSTINIETAMDYYNKSHSYPVILEGKVTGSLTVAVSVSPRSRVPFAGISSNSLPPLYGPILPGETLPPQTLPLPQQPGFFPQRGPSPALNGQTSLPRTPLMAPQGYPYTDLARPAPPPTPPPASSAPTNPYQFLARGPPTVQSPAGSGGPASSKGSRAPPPPPPQYLSPLPGGQPPPGVPHLEPGGYYAPLRGLSTYQTASNQVAPGYPQGPSTGYGYQSQGHYGPPTTGNGGMFVSNQGHRAQGDLSTNNVPKHGRRRRDDEEGGDMGDYVGAAVIGVAAGVIAAGIADDIF